MGKTRGMGAARKLKTHRRRQRWADKAYKKSHLGNEWKKPFAGSSHAKGIVLEKIGIEAKQPNSAIRKCARVQLIKNGKKIAAFVPNDGCLNYIEENDEVLIVICMYTLLNIQNCMDTFVKLLFAYIFFFFSYIPVPFNIVKKLNGLKLK
ncbi:40S ribosomal protein S23 isoform X1 [Phoenix dactylifera]|uniref:40S ribosomal protein S23 isoform X1 n=1 Tax=Phoenix dactylifera TaxID=42345 RepID=A0A8B9A8L0_PHODC|nr:40S ribosomal protein S23 isoform X1 [Phoenix dactylifera]